jgi:peroxiredoxin
MLSRLLAFVCLVYAAQAATPRPLADVPIPTPDFKKISVKQYRGKVVLLVLLSTSCGDCVASVPILNKIQTDFGPRGLQVIGAAFDDNAANLVQAFAARYRPNFPMGFLDQPSAIKIADIPPGMRPFVPIVMFIDRTGVVQQQFYGDSPIFKQEEKTLRAMVDSLLKFNANASKAATK